MKHRLKIEITWKVASRIDDSPDFLSDTRCVLCWSKGPATGTWKWNTWISKKWHLLNVVGSTSSE